MEAIRFPARNEVVFGTLPEPVAGPGEVVVEVRASGICHTDYEVLKANYGTGAFPVVPGHEYAGVIAEVGSGVNTLSEGDRVVVDPNIECGTCRACKKGWAHLCEKLGAYGVTTNGGFSQFSVVKASAVHAVGDLEFSTAALAEPMGCVLNGVNAVHDETIDSALIFGAGPMGLLFANALKVRGTSNITFADIDETRLELATSFGFGTVASGSAELERYRQFCDLAVEATGVPSVAGDLINYIANGGRGLFFGVCPSDARIEISPFEVFRRQITLVGTHSLNHNIPEALEVISECGRDIARIVSHRLSLQDTAEILASRPPKGSLKIQAVLE